MGVVYLAEDPRLHRPVALKTMSANLAGDADLLKRFYREAESAGQLNHPNIVTIYDIDEAEGIPFIAMQFLEGESLERIIRSRKEMTAYRKLDLIMQTCRGLHYAHQHGIVHRDVKPANIMVLNDGMVKIVDFGIARLNEASMTRTGLVLGTPMYMSPEQIRGKPVDNRSDIFAVGVILYELLTNHNPFAADNVPTIIFKVLNDVLPALSTQVQNCPPPLDEIVAKATAKERNERYQNAEDLAFDLQQQAEYLKRHMMEVYVNEGEQFMEAGNLTLAREALQKVLEIDSHHDLARTMLGKVQGEIQTRQAQEKIDQGLRQARQALQNGLLDDAVELLDEVLRLDPENAQALKGKQHAVEERERQRAMARLRDRAEELATAGDLPGTKDAVEKLLALDPQHERAQQLLEWVKKELAEQERQAQVRQFLESAQAYLSGRDFAVALDLLEKAHQIDPVNLEIESLIRSAREGQQKEEQRKLLNQRLADIQEAITGENFDLALQRADQALQEFPDNSQAAKLRAQAAKLGEVQKRRRYVEQQLQAARDCFQKNDFASAIGVLESTLEKVPGDARLTAYLRTVREAEEVAALEKERQTAIREANEQIRSRDFDGAIRTLQTTIERSGQSPELADLLQFAREQKAEQKRQMQVRQLLESAQASLSERDFAAALNLLEKAHQLDPVNLEIESLIGSAREGQQKEERKKVLNQHLADIQEAIGGEDFDRALHQADQALREFPNNSQVVKLRAQAARLGEVQKKRHYVEQQLQAARDFFQKNDFASAIGILEKTLEAAPDDARLTAYLRTVQEAQEAAALEEVRQTAIRQANELIRARDFDRAIGILQAAVKRSGESPEVIDLLQYAREQQAEQQRQEQVRQLLARVQALLREENFEEAIQLLVENQRETPSGEVAEVLSSAQVQRRRYEQRREETLEQALHWLQVGDPAKAVAVLDAAPKAYLKDPRFPQTYTQAREALDKLTSIQQTLEQVEKSLTSEHFREAGSLLRAALRTFPDDPLLLTGQQKLQEAVSASLRNRLVKQLEEARLAMGRMQFHEAAELLSSPEWQAGQFPDLASEAATLREEARQRDQELVQRQTIIQPVPAVRPPSPAASDPSSLMESQKRLREALQGPPVRHEKVAPPVETVRRPSPKKSEPVPAPPASSTAPALPVPAPQPVSPVPAATPPRPAQVPEPSRVAPAAPSPAKRDRGVIPQPAPPQTPAIPAPPKPAAAKPAVAAPARPVTAPLPESVTIPPVAKKKPMTLWAGVAIVVVVLVAAVGWMVIPHGGKVGHAKLTSTPWADVVSVKTKQGQDMNLTGRTPLQLDLSPGDYVIELKTEDGTRGQVEVTVKSGEVASLNYPFPQVKIDDMVDELVPK